MSKGNKLPFCDLYLPNHPVLEVIEDYLKEIGGLDPKKIRKDDEASVVFHFRTTEHFSVVVRLYRYAGDFTYYLHMECAFALSLMEKEADLLPISSALLSMNGELPCTIRVGQSDDFLVSQAWFHLAKMDSPEWLPSKDSFWWVPETILRLIGVAEEARDKIKDLPGFYPLPAPQPISTAAN